ncbi:MAG TPA: hypothetical protein VJ810_10930 [Blastocatellia bacterium]|nr:hypothetical protein [Blastocatellia bacterium]
MFPFVETIQSDQGAPGAGDTVIQNNSIDEARRLGILGTARGAHITSRFSLKGFIVSAATLKLSRSFRGFSNSPKEMRRTDSRTSAKIRRTVWPTKQS